MSFEPRTEIECLMELVSRDRTWFISNLKTLKLNAWFYLLRIQGIETWWVIIDPNSLGIWFEYFCELIWLEIGMRCLWMRENKVNEI